MDGVVEIPLPGQPMVGLPGSNGERNPTTTLRHFIAGPENRLAKVAVEAVLSDRPASYGPVVLYGPSGTGKSHLARGLATQWKVKRRRSKVVYTTSDEFARELFDAIETHAMEDFQARNRQAALLVFEDVQRLGGKPAAEEELVHTLDALIRRESAIVVTAAGPPARLPELTPELRSRLGSGLTVPLVPPAAATRLAIVQRLAAQREIVLAEECAEILAEGFHGTVPELAGALIRLAMPARLNGHGIGLDEVRSYLAERDDARRPKLADIASATARFFSLKVSDLRSRSRRRAVVVARDVAMYISRRRTRMSLEQIGDYFGGRDHSTVMHGCRKTESLLKTDPAIREAVEQLEEFLADYPRSAPRRLTKRKN